jgi:hypothetical protein
MSSFPTVPLDEISICDCETPSAVNGYSLPIVNYTLVLSGWKKVTDLKMSIFDPI